MSRMTYKWYWCRGPRESIHTLYNQLIAAITIDRFHRMKTNRTGFFFGWWRFLQVPLKVNPHVITFINLMRPTDRRENNKVINFDEKSYHSLCVWRDHHHHNHRSMSKIIWWESRMWFSCNRENIKTNSRFVRFRQID